MNKKILVVDDMPDVLTEVRHILSQKYEVHIATSGREALELCERSGPYALVLTDEGMPNMNGTELLAHMQRGWPDTMRIMMTGYADLELAIEALRDGAIFRFLQKPFRPRDLIDAVTAALERFHRVQEERLLTAQLQYSRESLLSLTESLEHRLATQIGRMRRLQRFALELAQTASLSEVAELTAAVASKLLAGRAVRVEFEREGVAASASCGMLPLELHHEPIAVHDGRIGAIHVADRDTEGRRMAEGDREVLASLVCISAVAAHGQLSRLALDVANDATVCALSRLAENRDDETGKHLDRVSRYCVLIANALRAEDRFRSVITEEFVRDIGRSAPLHDIGKVGIPDTILLKPGPLDEPEWEIMRRHTTIGANTLRHVIERTGEQSHLRMAHDIAWCHHERWDGGGYPRGLAGAEIPLAARIASLADCYDALTTWRPYKDPWSHEAAVAYVLEHRGSQFDPEIVDVFERLLDEFDAIRAELADRPEEVVAKRVA